MPAEISTASPVIRAAPSLRYRDGMLALRYRSNKRYSSFGGSFFTMHTNLSVTYRRATFTAYSLALPTRNAGKRNIEQQF